MNAPVKTRVFEITAIDGPMDGWHGFLDGPVLVYAGDSLTADIYGYAYWLVWEGDRPRFKKGEACLTYEQSKKPHHSTTLGRSGGASLRPPSK